MLGKTGSLIRLFNLFYQSPAREELFKHLLDCDVVVYNISESSTQQQVDEATWAITGDVMECEDYLKNWPNDTILTARKCYINKSFTTMGSNSTQDIFCTPFSLLQTALHAKMETFKSRKMFILVSTVMTWALTKPKEPVMLKT